MDFTARCLLLVALSAKAFAEANVTCYDELGCFPNGPPWSTRTRPCPEPMPPEQINTQLFLYTRNQPEPFKVTLWPTIFLEGSDFDPKRPTVTITHGFISNSSSEWMHDIETSYLNNVDANVFLVDWGGGSEVLNYLQATSNTRIVGAELGRFGVHIVKMGQDPKKIHAIGHSLGAHVSGYFGKRMVAANQTIGRITALDPAQPAFETEGSEVKLTQNDAVFVDVLHTDAVPFLPFLGFGMLKPVGDVDFYFNNGPVQPGCPNSEVVVNFTSLSDLPPVNSDAFFLWTSCSHGRAPKYFTWSLRNQDCLFVGRKMTPAERALKIGVLGDLFLEVPAVGSVKSCTSVTCTILGLITPEIPARGSFIVKTDQKPPYCSTLSMHHLKWLDNDVFTSKVSSIRTLLATKEDEIETLYDKMNIKTQLPGKQTGWMDYFYNSAKRMFFWK